MTGMTATDVTRQLDVRVRAVHRAFLRDAERLTEAVRDGADGGVAL